MDQLSDIFIPALIICGAQDKMTPPKYSEYLAENIGKAHIEVVPDAGHMVMLEKPDAVSGMLSRFLDAITYQPGQ
jgi:pimeloyl-ACP methyl ester carboxylesterase